jgi:chemotaxis protein MotA
MFAIIGIVLVFGSIAGGYLMEHGNLMVLFQPAEFLIICGSALGTLLIANPLPTVMKIMTGAIGVISGSRLTKAYYLETLKMLMELFSYARKAGMSKLEADIEDPNKSAVFKKYPKFLKDNHAVDFLCDTIRTSLSGVVAPFELDQMMDLDLETHHHEAMVPINALITVADALPGLGIVAAVLGIVITMGALGGPPEEIGKKVAAALVGTFLGILLCYGLLAPLAASMTKMIDAESQYYGALRVALIAFAKGVAPVIAVEMARRAIPQQMRPSFKEFETATRKGAAPAAAKAA